MFTHVLVGTNDLARAMRFYDAVLATVGVSKMFESGTRAFYRVTASPQSAAFGVTIPIDGAPACRANGGTIGFAAADQAAVEAWHAAGIANGGQDDGAPGIHGAVRRFGAYLRDPDGNKICVFVPPEATA